MTNQTFKHKPRVDIYECHEAAALDADYWTKSEAAEILVGVLNHPSDSRTRFVTAFEDEIKQLEEVIRIAIRDKNIPCHSGNRLFPRDVIKWAFKSRLKLSDFYMEAAKQFVMADKNKKGTVWDGRIDKLRKIAEKEWSKDPRATIPDIYKNNKSKIAVTENVFRGHVKDLNPHPEGGRRAKKLLKPK